MPDFEEICLTGYNQHKLYSRLYPSVNIGKAPVLILLHGLWTDSREFGGFPRMLSKYHNISVLTFDFSGHGRSEGEKLLSTRDIQYFDTRAAVDYIYECYKQKVLVLGHSFGSHSALVLQQELQRVVGAILVAPQIRSGDSLNLAARSLFKMIGAFYVLFPFVPSVYIRNNTSYEELFISKEAVQDAAHIGFIASEKNVKVCAYAISADNSKYVRLSEKPLLIVGCENDRQIPETRVRALAGYAVGENVGYYMLLKAGHSPFMELCGESLSTKVSEFCHEVTHKN